MAQLREEAKSGDLAVVCNLAHALGYAHSKAEIALERFDRLGIAVPYAIRAEILFCTDFDRIRPWSDLADKLPALAKRPRLHPQ
jgi:hypothetical protein